MRQLYGYAYALSVKDTRGRRRRQAGILIT
jgi:hypothetical protein